MLTIPRSELDSALYDAYGLQFLFDLVELDLAKLALGRQGLTLEQADIDRERQLVMQKLFKDGKASPDDYETYFQQLLEKQHLTRSEFELRVVKLNACLRKIVEPQVRNKLPEQAIRKGFAQMYGEKRQIADIQVANLKDAAEVQGRLAEGVPFDVVARQMSTDNVTAPIGGLWEPFSSQSPPNVVPVVIKDAAFALDKESQVCPDPLNDGKNFHIIKLIKITPPNEKVMKFEDVKDDVRRAMEDQIIEIQIKSVREQLARNAQQFIEIEQPGIRAQWDKLRDAQLPKSVDREKVLNQIGKDNQQGPATPGDRTPTTMPGR